MSPAALWVTVLVASALCLGVKLAGHLVPAHRMASPRVARTADLVTAALLAALVVVQAVGGDREIVLDARLPALAVAAVALALRAPFVVVVVLAAATAAALRALGAA
ncbi:AzlD domain-containing protein [Cellulomonas sp. PhB143]|uniref:AzlD domain-containing protein n=1 Tax=Cellulomonas sp. PhB143 TaxID=2485186 RepID=UPI000F464936|nr:AzlD domain-containing protein [Cellulomonas sp. PhB143]ROS77157.1 branched-subunit amino acid transport protein AzlD [Cellulomonas sp. PhB143]